MNCLGLVEEEKSGTLSKDFGDKGRCKPVNYLGLVEEEKGGTLSKD